MTSLNHKHIWKEKDYLTTCDCGIRTWLRKPPTTNELTKYECEVLEHMPIDEWFRPFDLRFPIIHDNATCERLYCKGFLRRKSINTNGFWETVFIFEPEPNRNDTHDS